MEGELTIGAFGGATALTPKALRLYDELGLLRPVRVDPFNGYRYYTPAQVPQARLVAWLRRIGMPLARIRRIAALDPRQAAAEVAAYWAQQEHDHTARRALADALLRHLLDEETAVPEPSLTIRYAALSDTGLVRGSNQDTAHAEPGLLAVADGYGAEGDRAGSRAVAALRRLHASGAGTGAAAHPGELLGALAEAVERARTSLRDLPDSGTTLTALLWTGSELALVHIGDSRAYLLRDGSLLQITHDHSFVQSLVDEGRLTPAEAASHPQRSLLLRALDAGDAGDEGGQGGTGGVVDAAPDLSAQQVSPGDRYLLASDGLTSVVEDAAIAAVLADSQSEADPERAVRDLIALARSRGGPDNIACAVADVLPARAG